jgi:hypothetical protein
LKRVFLLFAAAFALSNAGALAGPDLDAPPDGVTPTSATVVSVLKNYDSAAGSLLPGVSNTRSEQWTFDKAGLRGVETLVRDGTDYYARVAAGPFVDEYGSFFGKNWHRDANGVVSDVRELDYSAFEAQLFMHAFGDAEDPKNDVKLLGEVSGDQAAYVLEVTNGLRKHPEYVFFDKKSGLIDRIVQILDGKRYITTYSDYRPTKGLAEPWHIHITDGDSAFDGDFVRQSLTIGQKVDLTLFSKPASKVNTVSYSGHVSLPAKVVLNEEFIPLSDQRIARFASPNVVVRVIVNGRGLDFALSSGHAESLIDYDVAQELGLGGFGKAIRDKDGNPVAYETLIPQAKIGDVTLNNFAVTAVKFHYHVDGETKIVGLLGYDFLSSGVFKIDFDNGKVDLSPSQSFAGPPQGAFPIDLTFDDGLPFFDAEIAGHETRRFLLDNDFDFSVLFGGFTERYPDAAKDIDGNVHGTAVLPLADEHNYGRDASIWVAKVPDLIFGTAHFVNYNIMAADVPGESGDGVDAVLGGDLLSMYDMYLDYSRSRVYLKPNKRFYAAFHFGSAK